MRRITTLTLAALALAIALPATAGDLTWKAGQKIETIVDTKTEMVQTLPDGSSQEVKQTQRMQYEILVREIDDAGNATCVLKYGRVASKMENAMGGFDYDSGDAEKRNVDNQQVKGMRALAGAELILKISPERECLSVAGVDKIVDKILESVPEGEREMARGMLAGMLNEEMMKKNFGQLFLALPADAKVGSEWTNDIDQNLGFGTATLTNTYSVTKVEGDKVTVTTASKLKSSKANPNMPMEMTVDSVKATGTTTLDRNHPLLVDSEQTVAMDIMLLVQGAFEIPSTSKTTTKTRSRIIE